MPLGYLQYLHAADPTDAPADGEIPVYSAAQSGYVPTTFGGIGGVTTGQTLTDGVTIVGNGTQDIKKSTLTATVVKSTSGTLSAATAGTDYIAPTTTGVTRQIVSVETGTEAHGTTTVPYDNTIPQNTEGTEFMTLAITPTSATNKLRIDVSGNFNTGTADRTVIVSIFQDSTANALASVAHQIDGGNKQITFTHIMTSGTTSSTTFKVRAGMHSAATTVFNGTNGSGSLFGGVMASSIVITEYVP